MSYGVKCPTCGLMQMPRPACKACGAALPGPPEAPKARPRVPSEDRAPGRVITRTTGTLEGMGTTESVGRPGTAEPTEPRGIPPENICSQCGLVFRKDELIRFGDRLVCAGCKPLYVQGLREGVVPAGEMVYAGFWIRTGARIIDSIILWLAGLALGLVIALIPGRGPLHVLLQYLLGIALGLAYVTYFVGTYSATPGKMACGLKIMRPDGEKLTYARACGRFFADMLSAMTLCIGYIIAAFDEEKRALHDRICDTRVVKV